MSSPSTKRFPHSSSLPSRLSASNPYLDRVNRIPTPSPSSRQRNASHLTSTLFETPSQKMTLPVSFLPPHHVGQTSPESTQRHHNQISFEWQIQSLRWLKAHVEDQPAGLWAVEAEMENPESLPEALKRGVIIGDGWYKLDIARTIPHPHSPKSTINEIAETHGIESPEQQTLSLYIGAHSLEDQILDFSYTASIFVGIKPVDCGAGNRFAGTQWIWTTSADWEFSRETEYWETQLPLLSTLVDREDLATTDSFSLCVQIGSPIAYKPNFTLPDQLVVPHSFVDGLAGLLDSTTGDVRFVCLEHTQIPLDEAANPDASTKMQILSRKRVIYAHSAVLKARGDYFRDLLKGGFSESETIRRTDARVTTICVDDAGFETVYWLLKFVYANQLRFADSDELRLLMDELNIDRGEVIKLLSGVPACLGPAEWEYRRLPVDGESQEGLSELDFDARTVKSVSSTGTSVSRQVSRTASPPLVTDKDSMEDAIRSRPASAAASTLSRTSNPSTTSSKVATRASPHTSTSAGPIRTRIPTGNMTGPKIPSNPSTGKPPAAVPPQMSPNASVRSHFPLPRFQPEPDPHPHPCPSPAPASALSVYMLSHRYRLDVLEGLAKEHILTRMTSDNCMPMLLASYRYENLHSDVLEFVVEHWPTVQVSSEFFKCIQEISAGVWG